MLVQAYAGSLRDLAPLDGGWTWPVAAKETLDELILDRDLYALVTDVSIDTRFFPTINVTLELFDTSGEEDIIIGQELVAKGLAKKRGK